MDFSPKTLVQFGIVCIGLGMVLLYEQTGPSQTIGTMLKRIFEAAMFDAHRAALLLIVLFVPLLASTFLPRQIPGGEERTDAAASPRASQREASDTAAED